MIQLIEIGRHRRRVFAGRVHHGLRCHGDSFRIEQKKLVLIDNDEVIDNLTFLV